ncbi:DUF4055 domain-containing protein [Candidatus Dependentiae bacterium]|nr:MAG: DUF4055 domain-containing protein [Candidatus Dependentiae bacterium]
MAVNHQRADYKKNLPIWQKCRDVVEGQEKIHEEGELYLASLTGQDATEYGKYKDRALFYNATSRTVDAMSGLLFRKSPTIQIPDAMQEMIDNIDLQGNHIETFSEQASNEILITGRLGILVEHPQNPIDSSTQMTKADAAALNMRPFLVKFKAEDIINWATTVVNNITMLSLVVLKEVTEVVVDFEPVIETRYRVLKLDAERKYFQQVWKEQISDNGKDVSYIKEGEDIYPKINGKSFGFIPFIFVSAEAVTHEIVKSPILDLVNVNLSHYKTSADLEHGSHYTALPTAVVTGHTLEENQKLKIGSSEAWVFSEPEAKAFYLEFEGKGLDSLEKRLERKEQQMAALGARMLATEKAQAEAAETHNIKRQGEYSALSSISSSLSDGLTRALRLMADWSGIESKELYYEINKDFVPGALTPQGLLALVQTWQSGGMAFPDFVKCLQKGEVIDADRTPEDIKSDLEAEGPTFTNDPAEDDDLDPDKDKT